MSLDASTVWHADFAWALAILCGCKDLAWARNWELVHAPIHVTKTNTCMGTYLLYSIAALKQNQKAGKSLI